MNSSVLGCLAKSEFSNNLLWCFRIVVFFHGQSIAFGDRSFQISRAPLYCIFYNFYKFTIIEFLKRVLIVIG